MAAHCTVDAENAGCRRRKMAIMVKHASNSEEAPLKLWEASWNYQARSSNMPLHANPYALTHLSVD